VNFGRRARRALIGSAAKLTTQETEYVKRLQQPWQNRCLGYYNTVGEINFASKFYARMLARVLYYPATKNADGTLTKIEGGPAVDLLDRIQDPGGGRRRLQYDYGRLMFVTGEGVLLVTNENTDLERWRFVWRDEVVVRDGVAFRKDATGQVTGEQGTAYRMWTPHPINSDLADSPLHAVLDIAEELLILTTAVRSTAVTRLLNGVLLLPTEAAPAPFEEGLDEDPEVSPFLQRLTEHIAAQIENPGAAEARAPFLLEAGYEYLDQVRWLELHNPQTDYMERDLRIEAIKRLALALDMPPEALLGMSDVNHWTGQQVQWDMWRAHGIPLADQFANDLNDTYLRPALRDGGFDWQDVVIAYDDSQVVVSPDQTAVADQAMDRMAISFDGYRQLKGIPPDMAPSDEEQRLVAGVKMRDPVAAGLEDAAPPVHGPTPNPDVSQNGQSMTPPQPTDGRVVSRQEARTASILGAAQLAIRNCRAKAGARLRAKVVRPPSHGPGPCADCQEAIVDVPNARVAAALGLEALQTIAANDPIALVKGGTDDFRGILEEWGVDAANRDVLAERIEAWAASTLFEPNTPDLPAGFAAHVEFAMEVKDNAVAH
jgi:hypothetical protein